MKQFLPKKDPEQTPEPEKKEPAVAYVHTTDFPAFLQTLGISLLVSTYQAQRIMTFSPNGQKLFMLMRSFERPTGMAVSGSWIALCAKSQVIFFDGSSQLRAEDGSILPYDACYVPRRVHITGDILGHDIAFLPERSKSQETMVPELAIVNTRFSCLSVLKPDYSFVPFWKPPFVSEIAADDRCHLNGLAVDERGIQYVTALAETNAKEGWREQRATGGIVMEFPSGKIICRGLCMPHSPRIYQGRLWLLESGTGELLHIDRKTGQKTTIVKLPGYLRGLAFFREFAFIGTCKIREKHHFGGLPIEQQVAELECALHVVNVNTRQVVGFIKFTKGIEELFDIRILAGKTNPHILGFEEDTINGVYVIP